MKRALIVTPWFPNTPGLQAGQFIEASARAVADEGWEVCVLTLRPYRPRFLDRFVPKIGRGQIQPAMFAPRLDVRHAAYPALPRASHFALVRKLRERAIRGAVSTLISEQRPDVVHVHTEEVAGAAGDAARESGIPCVATIHSIDTRLLGDRRKHLRQYIGKSLTQLDRVVIVGEPLREFISEFVECPERICLVHNGVDLPTGRRTDHIFSGPKIRFVSVSNLHDGKGVDIALRALARFQQRSNTQWTYRIVGDGPERKSLEALSRQLGIQDYVEFRGAVRHDQVFSELNACDVFLLPSYREAFGIAYLEAMACGLITIGIRGQGPSAFIEHDRNGYLVEPQSVDDLTRILCSIASASTDELRDVARHGCHTAQTNFTWARHAETLTSLYGNIIARPTHER